MKFKITTAAVILSCLVFSSCKKEYTLVSTTDDLTGKAYLRIIHAAPSFRALFGVQDTFNVFIDNNKVNATVLTYGSVFPGATANPYLAVNAGLKDIKLSIPGKILEDSIAITTITKTLAAGSYYTLMLTDSIKFARDSSQIFLKDNLVKPLNTLYSLRFINAVYNDTVGKTIDIFSAKRNGNLFSNAVPGKIFDFTTLPYNAQFADTLFVRRSGTLINFASVIIGAGGFGNQKSYTLYFRGDMLLTTGAKARSVTYVVNQ
ncbi:MAG: DUF4397 domain-containing protein [Chitinophagaceae bacterium]